MAFFTSEYKNLVFYKSIKYRYFWHKSNYIQFGTLEEVTLELHNFMILKKWKEKGPEIW